MAQDEAVRQLCQCCWIVDTMPATAEACGSGPAALIRTLVAHCTGYARGCGVSVVLCPTYPCYLPTLYSLCMLYYLLYLWYTHIQIRLSCVWR